MYIYIFPNTSNLNIHAFAPELQLGKNAIGEEYFCDVTVSYPVYNDNTNINAWYHHTKLQTDKCMKGTVP